MHRVRTSAIASGPASPGTHASRIAAQCRAAHSIARGRPLTTTKDDRRAGGNDRFEQLLLTAEEAEAAPIAELAGRGVVRQPRPLAEDDEGDLGVTGGGDRGLDFVVRSVPDPATSREPDVHVGRIAREARRGSSRRSASSSAGTMSSVSGNAEGFATTLTHLEQRLHVEEVGVVAEQLAGAVGDRTDHGEAGESGPERQDAVVLEQDERPAREFGARRGPRRPSNSSISAGDGGSTRACSNRPSRNFIRSTRPTAASMQCLVDSAVGQGSLQRLAVRDRARQLDDRRRRARASAAAVARSSVSWCEVESISTPM